MSKRIILTVAPNGTPTLKTEGYQGKACKDASKFLEQALGAVESEKLTPEYHQTTPTKDQLKQGT